MLKKVAVDKDEINKLIRLKKYQEAKEFIRHIKDVIELVAINRVDSLIKTEAIIEKEKQTFIKIIQENIISKLLEDKDYILIDESYVDLMEERINKLKKLKERRKIIRRDKIV